MSRPALCLTQPSNLMGVGALSLVVKWSGMKLSPHLHIVPRSRKVEQHLHFPAYLHGVMLSKEAGKLCLYLIGCNSLKGYIYLTRVHEICVHLGNISACILDRI
jgi:hypothetical protein